MKECKLKSFLIWLILPSFKFSELHILIIAHLSYFILVQISPTFKES